MEALALGWIGEEELRIVKACMYGDWDWGLEWGSTWACMMEDGRGWWHVCVCVDLGVRGLYRRFRD